jgi:hypothetical protein
MRLRTRLFIAIPMAAIFIAIGVPTYRLGFFLGGMMTDSCSHLPGEMIYYLEVLWPAVMLAAAILPSVLILRQARWSRVLIALAVGLAASVGCYLAWIPILMLGC